MTLFHELTAYQQELEGRRSLAHALLDDTVYIEHPLELIDDLAGDAHRAEASLFAAWMGAKDAL